MEMDKDMWGRSVILVKGKKKKSGVVEEEEVPRDGYDLWLTDSDVILGYLIPPGELYDETTPLHQQPYQSLTHQPSESLASAQPEGGVVEPEEGVEPKGGAEPEETVTEDSESEEEVEVKRAATAAETKEITDRLLAMERNRFDPDLHLGPNRHWPVVGSNRMDPMYPNYPGPFASTNLFRPMMNDYHNMNFSVKRRPFDPCRRPTHLPQIVKPFCKYECDKCQPMTPGLMNADEIYEDYKRNVTYAKKNKGGSIITWEDASLERLDKKGTRIRNRLKKKKGPKKDFVLENKRRFKVQTEDTRDLTCTYNSRRSTNISRPATTNSETTANSATTDRRPATAIGATTTTRPDTADSATTPRRPATANSATTTRRPATANSATTTSRRPWY